MQKIVLGLIVSTALAASLSAQTAVGEPIARIGKQAVYEEDLLPSIGVQLWQLKSQEYELKTKALAAVVNQRLVEDAAKGSGLSYQAFLEQTVDRNLPAPDAAEIEGFYLAQKDRLNRPFEEIKSQLVEALVQAKRQQARQDYIDGLRRKTGVAILLNRPRVAVAADPSRLRGNPDAPVTIVEFGDFQCPFCQAVQPAVKEVLDKYKGRVRLGFRDFPLRQIHAQAQSAAEAARCAGEQGKFWEYHDLLYANQGALNPDALKQYARMASIDGARFETCLASGKFRPQIEDDLQSGTIAGITGTPAFYVNGIPLSGAQPASAFVSIIESELADVESKRLAAK